MSGMSTAQIRKFSFKLWNKSGRLSSTKTQKVYSTGHIFRNFYLVNIVIDRHDKFDMSFLTENLQNSGLLFFYM